MTVGDGAIIGAGAVVTKDAPPFAVVAGVPARVVKYRFPEETIARLLNVRWWRYDIKDLSGIHFSRPEEALDEIDRRISAGITERPVEFVEIGKDGRPMSTE